MTTLKAVLLGAVQGFSEFLPISSSGHLVIFNHLLASQGSSDLLFDVLVHLGTFLAVIAVFWKDVFRLIFEVFSMLRDLFTGKLRFRGVRLSPSRNFLYMLIVSLLPLFFVLPFKDSIEALFQNPVFVGFALLVTGGILLLSGRLQNGRIGMSSTTVSNALTVGFAQLFAVIPGISRSGSTITAGLASGFKRDYAVRYSFILSLPTTLAAVLLEVYDVSKSGVLPERWAPYLIGMAVAAVTGYAAIGLVKLLVRENKFSVFAWYCLVVGTATILYFGFIY
ncbi:MAG: undecaprenyl-diphosphate phosphatase [Clostridia bacterium]|nr:undecaprenyl-diphosphate phosphatase [Clostridia bacterium]